MLDFSVRASPSLRNPTSFYANRYFSVNYCRLLLQFAKIYYNIYQNLSEVGKSADHTSRWKPFFTEGTIRNLIDEDNPVILFGNLPNTPTTASTLNINAISSEGDRSNHAVVAYGYSSDKTCFIVHYDWESSYYPDARIDLGYFSLGSIYSFDLD